MSLPNAIVDYYLTHSPHAHSDKPTSAQSLDLSMLKWEKRRLGSLMKWIVSQHLSSKGDSRIRFSISNDVKETSELLFVDSIPSTKNENGGVFCIKNSLKASENNSINCKLTETYITCFFRHIRNSIAHGNYEFDSRSNLIMFKDQASAIGTNNPRPTAAFQTSVEFLNQLMAIISAGPDQLDESQLSSVPSYRVERKMVADVEDEGE